MEGGDEGMTRTSTMTNSSRTSKNNSTYSRKKFSPKSLSRRSYLRMRSQPSYTSTVNRNSTLNLRRSSRNTGAYSIIIPSR